MFIYNSLTNKKEEFIPINKNKITMYVCGPTVYNYVHIGNMRPVITFDMVYKYFKYLGYDVTYASNFTDINYKITKAAIDNNVTEREIANKYIEAYLEDLASYNCADIDYRPRVIDNLDNIFNFISKLIEKDYAYVVDGDVYFRVKKIKDYGILSNQNIEELESGARVEVDKKKEDALDFALWRSSSEGEVFDSPWGKGIPGWHTECVVMIDGIFNGKIDIHGGGIDLQFPHHENEIAQSMALHNHHLANYWMHNGHINVDGQKMSKSLNNFILARDFIKNYSSNVIKISMFKTHYRLPLNFTSDLLNEAINIDDKIRNVIKSANVYRNVNNLEFNTNIKDDIFEKYMNDDFNTPNVISYLLELVKKLNELIRKNDNNLIDVASKILVICDVLGLKYNVDKWHKDDILLYNNWIDARNNKDFDKADLLRKKLIDKNIL